MKGGLDWRHRQLPQYQDAMTAEKHDDDRLSRSLHRTYAKVKIRQNVCRTSRLLLIVKQLSLKLMHQMNYEPDITSPSHMPYLIGKRK
ncbi:hypothetical protein BpHYR1_001856 [Brachionus plicatilis]|uniref:Uncharacterized protein n=1 Tax=Brachionus plicatilis TaxID=10195 RepID=A0A3M7Q0U5_BRAPC|nr:hypothetical protein BpHYR1_001856 [Brachionus plicatilis]